MIIPLVLIGVSGIQVFNGSVFESMIKELFNERGNVIFEEDFTECTTNQCDDIWLSTNMDNLNISATENHLFWNVPQTNGTTLLHQMTFDLGSGTVPDTNWTLRFTVNLESFSQGFSQNIHCFTY